MAKQTMPRRGSVRMRGLRGIRRAPKRRLDENTRVVTLYAVPVGQATGTSSTTTKGTKSGSTGSPTPR